jgi:hypothetical protein
MICESVPYVVGGPGGEMKCPVCNENTPDDWKSFHAMGPNGITQVLQIEPPEVEREEGLVLAGSSVSLDYMYCANKKCNQLVVRVHETSSLPPHVFKNREDATRTWLARPRRASRAIDPLVPDRFKRDYLEAAAILEDSPRMSSVLSRKILGDLLEVYAGLQSNSLKKQIDDFIEDTTRPHELRQDLHYLREMGDISAHTQTDDREEIIEVDRDEAEWTLDVIDQLFDYFIVSPEKSKKIRKGMADKIAKAGRKEIPPLPDAPLEEES